MWAEDRDRIGTVRFRFRIWVGAIRYVVDTGFVTHLVSIYKMAAGRKRYGREA